MATKTSTKPNIFLCMNLLCYVLTAAATWGPCTNPSPPNQPPSRGSSGSSCGSAGGSGSIGVPGDSGGSGGTGGSGGIGGSGPGQQPATCLIDALRLGVSANLLGGLVGVVIGNPPVIPCYTLLAGLVDLEAAVCLCTAIKANVLGINLNVSVALSLLLNVYRRTPPAGFVCPN